jgi:surface antigen
MKILRTITALALIASLGACAETANNQKQTTGAVMGGVLGGVLGSTVGKGKGQTAGTIAGVLIGALAGGQIGKSMDATDRAMAERAAQSSMETAPTGTSTAWNNPDNGHSGSVTPTRTYNTASNQYCREYENSVYIDGRQEKVTGVACRQPDGTWTIQP